MSDGEGTPKMFNLWASVSSCVNGDVSKGPFSGGASEGQMR